MAKKGSSVLTLNVYEDRNIPRRKRYAGATYVHDGCPVAGRSAKPLFAMLRRRASSSARIVPRMTSPRNTFASGWRMNGRHATAGVKLGEI